MDLLYRKHEGVTLLCQNNDEQAVQIYGANDVMQELLGQAEEALKGRSFQAILSEKTAATVNDYLEYEGDTNDLARVVGRMRDLRFKHRDGHDIPVKDFKLVRIDARDRHQWFRLIVEDTVHKREVEAFKKILSENFKGHEVLDDESGLPDKASIVKDLELSQYYASTKGLNACFAYVRLDDFPGLLARYGRRTAVAALGQVAISLRRNLRNDDAIGRVGDDALGVILMDIEIDSARVVMNRLRWLVGAEEMTVDEMKRKTVSISIGFAPILDGSAVDLPDRCGAALEAEKNAFSQLTTPS